MKSITVTVHYQFHHISTFEFADKAQWYKVVVDDAYIFTVFWDGYWFYSDSQSDKVFGHAHEIQWYAEISDFPFPKEFSGVKQLQHCFEDLKKKK